jgi:hypothetical protein
MFPRIGADTHAHTRIHASSKQEGKTTFELKGQHGETIYIYPCFLHTLFVRYTLRKMVRLVCSCL